MGAKAASIIRVAVVAVLASAIGAVMVSIPVITPKVHSWLLGAGAVLFAISELYFRSLISELNAVFRRGGYSVWQMEQLQQVIPKERNRAWRLWNFSLWLKVVVAAIAILLQSDSLIPKYLNAAVFTAYALLFIACNLSFWAQRSFRHVESLCDQIAVKEGEMKEKKRLKSEIVSGNPHDFKGDGTIESYSKPAHPISS